MAGNVVPSEAGVSLHEKVARLQKELKLPEGPLPSVVDGAVKELGLEQQVGSQNLMAKVDACLGTVGVSLQSSSSSSPMGSSERGHPVPWRKERSGIGFGQSYESFRFGDNGYGSWGGMRYTPGYGYGGYGGYGSRYDAYSPYGPYGSYDHPFVGGWTGYGRDLPWDISYGGDFGYVPGYGMSPYGGRGSWGPYGGVGGLRRGSAAERALARKAAKDAGYEYDAPPAREDQVAAGTIQVRVPAGLAAGDRFTVQSATGDQLEVVVPKGASAGTLLTVPLPVQLRRPQEGDSSAPGPKE